MKDQLQEAISKLPSALINNSRKYLLNLAARFQKCPCASHAQRLEEFGLSVDLKDYGADQGIEKSKRDYSHIEDSGSDEPY